MYANHERWIASAEKSFPISALRINLRRAVALAALWQIMKFRITPNYANVDSHPTPVIVLMVQHFQNYTIVKIYSHGVTKFNIPSHRTAKSTRQIFMLDSIVVLKF
jgi:hypothetical protein